MRLNPVYKLIIGGKEISSAQSGLLFALDLRREKNSGADELSLQLGRDWGGKAALNDEISLSLGWREELTPVFSGQIAEIRFTEQWIQIIALGMEVKLLALRKDSSFLDQKAGDVVKALASEAGLATERVDDGAALPFYLVDSGRNLYEHCLRLAAVSGFDLYTTADGKLNFTPFTSTAADHTFAYGKDIWALDITRGEALNGVSVVPESPASSEGDETASWLVKDSQAHAAAAGKGGPMVSDVMLRTKETAAGAASGLLALSQQQAIHGTAKLTGNPAVSLGQAVQFTDTPDSAVAAIYQVVGIRHQLSRASGFVTSVLVGGMPNV